MTTARLARVNAQAAQNDENEKAIMVLAKNWTTARFTWPDARATQIEFDGNRNMLDLQHRSSKWHARRK